MKILENFRNGSPARSRGTAGGLSLRLPPFSTRSKSPNAHRFSPTARLQACPARRTVPNVWLDLPATRLTPLPVWLTLPAVWLFPSTIRLAGLSVWLELPATRLDVPTTPINHLSIRLNRLAIPINLPAAPVNRPVARFFAKNTPNPAKTAAFPRPATPTVQKATVAVCGVRRQVATFPLADMSAHPQTDGHTGSQISAVQTSTKK